MAKYSILPNNKVQFKFPDISLKASSNGQMTKKQNSREREREREKRQRDRERQIETNREGESANNSAMCKLDY